MDEEDDDTYRERIRTHMLTTVSTGPKAQYESAAMAVSSDILDAQALQTGDGRVTVYLIFASGNGQDALIDEVAETLNGDDARPLTDYVTVTAASKVTYTLNVQYQYDGSATTGALITEAVSAYKKWQEQTIGRAFDPDKLISLMYQAGATRVIIGSGSSFNGGDATYTEIAENEYCSGEINTAVIGG